MIDLRNTRVRLAIAGLGTIVLLVLLRSCGNHDAQLPAADTGAVPPVLLLPVDIVTVSSGSIAGGVRVTGTLQPLQQSSVNARVGGVVDEVPVRSGDSVHAGQVLVRQDTADLKAQLSQAEANLQHAAAEMKLAEDYQARKQELHDKQYLSDVDWATAITDTEARRAAFRVQQAAVEIARKALADATLVAPVAGIVARRNVEPGARVSAGQALMTLVDLAQMELAAEVPARDVPQIKVGNDLLFRVDGLANREFRSRIVRINPVASSSSRTITVYARVANADGALRGGMFASGSISAVGQRDNVLRIPAAAVRSQGGSDTAWLVRDGKLVQQKIALGARDINSGLVEVRDGLVAGEQVVLAQLGSRAPGTPVTIQESPGATPAGTATHTDASR